MVFFISNKISSLCETDKEDIRKDPRKPQPSETNDFISFWNTSKTSEGSSAGNQLSLPLVSDGNYDFNVTWGDGSSDTITTWNEPAVTHTYASEGEYTLTITGKIIGWRFNNGRDKLKIVEIKQWGCLNLGDSDSYFYGCWNLELTATDNLNLTGTTNLRYAFRDCTNLGDQGTMDDWNVSSVTDMSFMFYGATSFNQPIGSWDVSNVINMGWMLYDAKSFDHDIGNWNTSKVMYM
ncbi:MAG: BspA family leucine-rich repeat surface protein, partial [Candidatus Lokiarchaeota archaeon]|nr:BspA family leucine-rich repeat surface protein [Candidatus Lokiarchaeota archaeon]